MAQKRSGVRRQLLINWSSATDSFSVFNGGGAKFLLPLDKWPHVPCRLRLRPLFVRSPEPLTVCSLAQSDKRETENGCFACSQLASTRLENDQMEAAEVTRCDATRRDTTRPRSADKLATRTAQMALLPKLKDRALVP